MNIRLWTFSIILLAAGCAPAGGKIGDANDPAVTSDAAAMADETGSIGNAQNGKAPKK